MNTGELITTKTWDTYARDNRSQLYLYLEVNEHFVEVLGNMVKNAKSCIALKKDLSEFLKERKGFVEFADKNIPL